jgi:OFA family oxalate/formate antiporter-like MFS transporter
MLTAWGFASAFGPLLIAYMRQVSGAYHSALHVIAGVMAVSLLLPIIVSPPKRDAYGKLRPGAQPERQTAA